MDSLCSLSGQRECSSNEKQTKKQKVATMAWAAFQVLANRCIEWEKVEGMLTHTEVMLHLILKICKKNEQSVYIYYIKVSLKFPLRGDVVNTPHLIIIFLPLQK